MSGLCLLDDCYFWNWHYEPAAPLANVSHLLGNLFLNIPRKNQYIIWLGLHDTFRRKNWNTCTREKTALLLRAAVYGVIKEVLTNSAVIQQRVTFGWRSISNDFFILILRFNQKTQERALDGGQPI